MTDARAAERLAQARDMVARGEWPTGGQVFVGEDSPQGRAWTAYYAAFRVRPRWQDLGHKGRGWCMPDALPPAVPAAAAA